jgi:hypothetical protein
VAKRLRFGGIVYFFIAIIDLAIDLALRPFGGSGGHFDRHVLGISEHSNRVESSFCRPAYILLVSLSRKTRLVTGPYQVGRRRRIAGEPLLS